MSMLQEVEAKPGEDTLLESIRGLLGKIKEANGSLVTIENRLDFHGAENEETKPAHADARSYLVECHRQLDVLGDYVCRIAGALGE